MGRRGGLLCPFCGGIKLGRRLTQRGLGPGLLPYQVASSSIQPFGHNRHGPNTGGCAPFRGEELRPHLIQRHPGRGWPPYQVASWSIQPFGHHNRYGPKGLKIGWRLCLFSGRGNWVSTEHKVAWAEAYIHTKWHLSPSSRLATTDIGRKLGELCPFMEGRAGSPSNTMPPRLRPTFVPSGILIHT